MTTKALTPDEAASMLRTILSADLSYVDRLEVSTRSGSRLVYFGGGGTVAVYAPQNRSRTTGPGVLSASEDYLSVAEFASAYS
jgi:hypothetical protein